MSASSPLTRRALLAAMPGLGAGAALGEPYEAGTLAAAAQASGREFGCAVSAAQLAGDPAFRAAVARECATLTPELDLKWTAVEPHRGELAFAPMDQLIDFARAAGKGVHGHTLIWHRSTPPWAAAALAEPGGWSLVRRRFSAVMSRYGELIGRWDVVNEPIDPDGAGGLRDSPFRRAFGDDYIRRALETARRLAPNAKLLINEFGLDYDDAEDRARRRAFLGLVDRLKSAGAPLDGVGLQAHLHLGKGRLSQRALRDLLHELAARDLFILVTELDVKETDYALAPDRRDALVADLTKSYLDAALEEPKVIGVTTWGLSDRYSWLQVTRADLERRPDAWRDGTSPGANRGLPLDAALRPKAMHEAMMAAFRSAGSKSAGDSII